jgi:hypothetical protein
VIREAPAWFNDELERIGGTNRYGEPIFKLVWSEEVRMIIGGRFNDGFVGYRNSRMIPNDPHWVLMLWESPESLGDPDLWEMDYRQLDTGFLDCGSFPKSGRYRVLKQLMHRDIVQSAKAEMVWNPIKRQPEMRQVQRRKFVTYRMEPCGLILDLMIPMLMAWRLLGPQQKLQAVMDRKKREDAERDRVIKDAMADSRIRRSSQLVQKRAEIIEKGMDRAMAIASKYAPGMVTA